MKTWKLLLPIPFVAALVAMAPQDPAPADGQASADATTIIRISEFQYVDLQGKTNVVPARNVLEVRLLEDIAQNVRLEVLYENGDYSMVDAQAFHLLRSGRDQLDVRFVRSNSARLRFPRLP